MYIMKKPEECKSINDVREAIDQIDNEIILLLARRALYVYEAVKYKISVKTVRDEERQQKMLTKRKEWARLNNLNPDFIEGLYKYIVEFFVNEEIKEWKK